MNMSFTTVPTQIIKPAVFKQKEKELKAALKRYSPYSYIEFLEDENWSGNYVLNVTIGEMEAVGSRDEKTPWVYSGALEKIIAKLKPLKFTMCDFALEPIKGSKNKNLVVSFTSPIKKSDYL